MHCIYSRLEKRNFAARETQLQEERNVITRGVSLRLVILLTMNRDAVVWIQKFRNSEFSFKISLLPRNRTIHLFTIHHDILVLEKP